MITKYKLEGGIRLLEGYGEFMENINYDDEIKRLRGKP
jgi:hypothetical protein